MKYNKKEFLEKAKLKHDNRYNYDLVDYVNSQTKVSIICDEHGTFAQLPSSHLMGIGCPMCGIVKRTNKLRRNLLLFIDKSNKKHNNIYEYDLVDYVNNKTNVKIFCKLHGYFETTPERHLSGIGCNICSGYRFNSETIINRFIEKHGNRYDYDLVDYVNSQTKVNIICHEHGMFKQTPSQHIGGQGCPKCAIILNGENRLLNNNEFILKANLKHNNKYDYSLVKYVHSRKKVDIICKEHGIFKQIASGHLKGQGCPECSNDNLKRLNTGTSTEFILKANLKHNNKYDYSLVNYVHSQMKVDIICGKHGIFKQLPTGHLSGQGCPVCSESKGERTIRNVLEFNNIKYVTQKDFDDCRGNKKKLPFDFYLPEKNILIEYNGEQHYMPVKYFGGERTFNRIRKCDKIKLDYAIKNNIKIVIIKYLDFDNIENILKNEEII